MSLFCMKLIFETHFQKPALFYILMFNGFIFILLFFKKLYIKKFGVSSCLLKPGGKKIKANILNKDISKKEKYLNLCFKKENYHKKE